MIDELRKILEQASSPGDMATILIAGTAGFLVDAGLNAVGFLEPGVVGITSAAGALGIKKGIEANLAQRRERKGRQQMADNERNRANKLKKILNDEKYQDIASRLERELQLFDSDIVDIDNFKARIDEIVEEYRNRD